MFVRLSARYRKLDIEMFHDEYLKPIYFGVKSSKVNVTGAQRNVAGAGFCTLVNAGFF